jgi:hypothetical protein
MTFAMPKEWTAQGQPGNWTTSSGDRVEVELHRSRPTLPQVDTWPELIDRLQARLPDHGRLISCEPAVIHGLPGLTIITKTESDGQVGYRGQLIIPLRDRWWELTITAAGGSTDVKRAAAVAAAQRKDNKIVADADPDSARWDLRFPHAAVARIRDLLNHTSQWITVGPGLRSSIPFALPAWTATPSRILPAITRAG